MLRGSSDLPTARLTLLRCVRADLQQGRWAAVDARLAAARGAGEVLPTAEGEAWRDLVDRLTGTRIIDARAWAAAPTLAAPLAPSSSSSWLHQMVTAVAGARLAWRAQDASAFDRLLSVARQLRQLGQRRDDPEIARAGLLVQAAVAGGQYERDEMQLLLEDAGRIERTLADALGERFVPIVLAAELEADLLLQTDRYAAAAERYREVIARHPARVQSWLGLAEAYGRLGYSAEAAEARATATRLAPAFRIE